MRLLGLYAHPDDETFCTGGTFARYAARGAEVMAVSATRGQAGQIRDPAAGTRRSIGTVREREMRHACAQLGVRHAVCLDYRDGALIAADREALVADFTRIIREFQPTAVFTFGPDGGYGHPDHIVVGEAASAAWDRACEADCLPEQELPPHQPDTLYYAHFPAQRRRLLDRVVQWLVSNEERFRGDVRFIRAMLHIAEEARDLRYASDHMQTRWFPAETFIIEQGETATTLFLILSGQVDAVREHEDGRTEFLDHLGPGHFFGELGIASRRPRNAHIIARTDVTCLELSPAEPAKFLGRGEGAHLAGSLSEVAEDAEDLGEATARIDVGDVIERKIAAMAAYRSQFALDPEALPASLLKDLFGVEYFVQIRPRRVIATEIT